MKKFFYSFSVIMLTFVMLVTANAANNTPFADVPDESWYTESVNYCYKEDLMKGSSATTFSPNMTVDRSQIVQVLANMTSFDSKKYEGKTSFPDVEKNDWFASAVEWAKVNKVAKGNDKGNFEPVKPVTREQLAQFIYNYAAFVGIDNTKVDLKAINSFADVSTVSSWAKTAMAWNVEKGILTGNNNKLMPGKSATRAELAVIMERFDKYVNKYGIRYLLNEKTPYETDRYTEYIGGETFEMGGISYTNGFSLATDYSAFAVFNLNSEYSEIEFDLGHVDGSGVQTSTVNVYCNGELKGEYTVEGDALPQRITMDVSGVDQFKITVKNFRAASYGLGDITVK